MLTRSPSLGSTFLLHPNHEPCVSWPAPSHLAIGLPRPPPASTVTKAPAMEPRLPVPRKTPPSCEEKPGLRPMRVQGSISGLLTNGARRAAWDPHSHPLGRAAAPGPHRPLAPRSGHAPAFSVCLPAVASGTDQPSWSTACSQSHLGQRRDGDADVGAAHAAAGQASQG